MKINRAGLNNNKTNFKGARSFVRTLANTDALTTTILLETGVTSGRGINAYKRGGFPEFRERFTDDVVSAVFWMKGVDMFNKLGNIFGEKVLKLPVSEFDVGKDALRTPFNNIMSDLGSKMPDENAVKNLEKKLAAFKFGKIILSTILAIGFVGFILPKINQAITKKMMSKEKKNTEPIKTLNDVIQENSSFDAFEDKINNKKPSFKGLSSSTMAGIANCLENNKICKMLTCDVGILTGRVKTARNADEGREYFFRDASSSFFYYASTPLLYALMQKASNTSKVTTLDPVASQQLSKKLTEQLAQTGSMNAKEFTKKMLGVLDDKSKEVLERLPFNSDVISLEELKKFVSDEKILQKAHEMSKLQPKQANVGRVLTKGQVIDVFKNGSINTPEFMQAMYKEKFGETLTNPYKFISMKKITGFRNNIEKYIQGIVETAEKTNGGVVDKKLIEKINKKSFAMSMGFRVTAIVISALALGVVIPKLQYAMTARRTGSTKAPGLREYENENKKA